MNFKTILGLLLFISVSTTAQIEELLKQNKINYLQKDLNVNFLKSGRKFNEIEFEVFIDSLTQNINLKPH